MSDVATDMWIEEKIRDEQKRRWQIEQAMQPCLPSGNCLVFNNVKGAMTMHEVAQEAFCCVTQLQRVLTENHPKSIDEAEQFISEVNKNIGSATAKLDLIRSLLSYKLNEYKETQNGSDHQ